MSNTRSGPSHPPRAGRARRGRRRTARPRSIPAPEHRSRGADCSAGVTPTLIDAVRDPQDQLEHVEALDQQFVADRQRRQKAQHVAVGAAATARSPRPRGRRRTAPWSDRGSGVVVPALTSSTAIIAPRPRTSPIRSSSACSAAAAGPSSAVSICWRRATRPSASMVAMVASAAAHAIGLPP